MANIPFKTREKKSKTCKTCGKTFERMPRRSNKWWESAIYCSKPCIRCSSDTKVKMRISHLGKKYSKMSEEGKRNISIAKKGSKQSKETIKKRNESRAGLKHSDETKKKLSLLRTGKGNRMFGKIGVLSPNWKGGVTPESSKIRNSNDGKIWVRSVFERNNFTCQKCFIKSSKGETVYLNAHHIKNFSSYPELRFAIDNGITFCKNCHKNFHKLYGIKNNNELQLKEYLL